MFVLVSFENTEVEGRGTSKRAYLCVLRSLGAYSILMQRHWLGWYFLAYLVFLGMSCIFVPKMLGNTQNIRSYLIFGVSQYPMIFKIELDQVSEKMSVTRWALMVLNLVLL